MWVSRREFERLARDAGAAGALQAENALLRNEVAQLRRRNAKYRKATRDAAIAPPAAPAEAFALDDGLPVEVRQAITEFAGADLSIARHLTTVAHQRLRTMAKRTPDAVAALADALASGSDPDEVLR